MMQCPRTSVKDQIESSSNLAYQAPPPMGFSRQKYWSGVPLPSLPVLCSRFLLSILYIVVCIHQSQFSNLWALFPFAPGGHVRMWKLDHKESRMPKNWCFWSVVLEKTLESRLHSKDIKPVNCKENQSWIFIGRTDAEAETAILWPPDGKSWLIRKDPDAGEDWRQEEKGMTEDEMVGWHHRLNGHGSGCTLGVGDGQGGLVCCGSWGPKELDTTERLNWTELKYDVENRNAMSYG